MANPANITRRAAIVGALAAPAAAALPVAAADPVTLDDLAREFKERAMALDPTITRMWIGRDDLMAEPGEMRLSGVYIERANSPFVRPAAKRAS